jgi:glycosyltransferase involved in cell wall biosynthesis
MNTIDRQLARNNAAGESLPMQTVSLHTPPARKLESGMPSAEPVRVMKVMTAYFSGGTEGQVLKLTRSLDPQQFDLQFACLRKWGDILKEFEKLNLPITEFRIRNLYSPQTFLQQLRFAAHLREKRIQIVHSYNFYSNIFAIPAARIANVPVVLASIRDRGIYLTPAQKVAQKWACGFADRILVNADSIRDWLLEQGYQENKIVVIKNGIDMSLYDIAPEQNTLRKELGIAADVPVVVMMSRLNAQKGVDDFIKAAALVNRIHPDVQFLIVGAKVHYENQVFSEDSQYLEGLYKLVADLGISDRLKFTGHRTDTPAILSLAAVSVLPSHSEGLSNTLLESMAAGVPTVATDVGGNPELIRDGINGLLIPIKSPDRLAAALITILDNPALARQFGTEAKKMAVENFSLVKMTADTHALYLGELGRATRPKAAR